MTDSAVVAEPVVESPSTGLVTLDEGFRAPDMPRHRSRAQSDNSRAGRKGDDYVFEPKESSFFTKKTFTFHSRPIQIAHNKTAQRLAMAFYETSLIVPIVARDDEAVGVVLGQITTTMKSVEQYLNGELARIEKMLTDNGHSNAVGAFSNPIEHEVKVYTPNQLVYMQLLNMADLCIAGYARVWQAGFMGDIDFKKCQFAIRMRVVRLAQDIWNIHNRSYLSLQRAKAEAAKRRESATSVEEIAHVEGQTARIDNLLGQIEERGGMEPQAPDFGKSDIAADHPTLMQKEDSKAAKNASKPASRKAAGAAAASEA